MPIRYFEGLSS